MGTFLSASTDPSSLFGRGGIDPAGGNFISSSISSSEGLGMGNLPSAISTNETPKLQMSDSTEYFVPESLSGYNNDHYFCNLLKTFLTAMYDLVPTKELAVESINSPLTPKSHSLISPNEFTKIFDGFTSNKTHNHTTH